MRLTIRSTVSVALLLLPLTSCNGTAGPSNDTTAAENPSDLATATAIPASLAPFGNGYPKNGAPCRQLGESAATSSYLDDSAMLVGCANRADAETLGGVIVGENAGITLVSVPIRRRPDRNGPPPPPDGGDALVPGTDYNATTTLACGFKQAKPTASCQAGVKRKSGDDGVTLVEIMMPGGGKRTIFFHGTTATGADGSQADGSNGWSFKATRDGDETTVSFGPETYVIVDALIEGG